MKLRPRRGGDCDGGSAQGRKTRAACAAVCSQWQAHFEKIIFRKLVLHERDLKSFEKIVKRRVKGMTTARGRTRGTEAAELLTSTTSRMPKIQHIWLRVELPNYTCHKCRLPPRNRAAMRWEKADAKHGQQPTLELSAHSPCDSQHLLIGDPEHEDDYPYRAGIAAQKDYIARGLATTLQEQVSRDPAGHDQNNGPLLYPAASNHPILNRNSSSAERLTNSLKFENFGVESRPGQPLDRLPEVKMVSSLLMRRQYYRPLDYVHLRKLALESLTGLRNMRCESWRPQFPFDPDWKLALILCPSINDKSIFGPTFPSPMETFSLFEDFSIKMHGPGGVIAPRLSGIRIILWVAMSAPNMENLAVSFVIDAKVCLQPQSRTLPKLKSIALTSQQWLEPTQKNTQKLLHLAAKAALQMPSLQIMEIWACGNGHAAIFRYEATGTAYSSAARLTWRCSWDVKENPIKWDGVIAAWEHVAATNAGRLLRFREDPLPHGSHRYKKYGAILHQLKLRNLILDPISVMQVRMGTGAEDEPEVEEWRASVPDSYWSEMSRERVSMNES